MDYFGYSYDIVEVNSLTKSQLDWSSYKKSPTVAIQIPSKDNPNEYEQVIEVIFFVFSFSKELKNYF